MERQSLIRKQSRVYWSFFICAFIVLTCSLWKDCSCSCWTALGRGKNASGKKYSNIRSQSFKELVLTFGLIPPKRIYLFRILVKEETFSLSGLSVAEKSFQKQKLSENWVQKVYIEQRSGFALVIVEIFMVFCPPCYYLRYYGKQPPTFLRFIYDHRPFKPLDLPLPLYIPKSCRVVYT